MSPWSASTSRSRNADQAQTLRRFGADPEKPDASPEALRSARVIAVASGKGGVGKTNLAANLGLVFAEAGARVLLIDGDLGLANLDIALGITPQRNLLHVTGGEVELPDVLCDAPGGVKVLPACSGSHDLTELDEQRRYALFTSIDALDEHFDTVIIDTAAGVGSNALSFAAAAGHVLIVATGEPTSLADAYAFIKVLHQRNRVDRVHLVANMVRNAAEGEEVYRKLAGMLSRFLDVSVDYLGYVVRDRAVNRSICSGIPVHLAEPDSAASRCIRSVAHQLARDDRGSAHGGVRLFWRKLLNLRKAS